MKNKLVLNILNKIKEVAEPDSFFYKELLDEPSLPPVVILSAKINGTKLSGFGTGHTIENASFKALMELVERTSLTSSLPKCYSSTYSASFFSTKLPEIYKKYGNNDFIRKGSSNGIAVHTQRKSAIENSINELIERHTVLSALIQNIPPQRIDHSKYIPTSYKLPKGFEMNFYSWIGALKKRVVVARVRKENLTAYSFGCHNKMDIASMKAFFELTPRIYYLKSRFHTLFHDDLNFHFSYHLKSETPWTDSLFSRAKDAISSVDTWITKRDIWCGEKPKPYYFATIKGLHFFQSISPHTMQLFQGSWDKEKIYPKHLENFILPPEPHIIG